MDFPAKSKCSIIEQNILNFEKFVLSLNIIS